MEQKYDFVEVTLEPNNYELVKEVYRLHKEQANKIFDLSCGIETNEDILDYVKVKIDNDIVLLAIDKTTDRYAGCLIFDNINMFNGDIISCGVHLKYSPQCSHCINTYPSLSEGIGIVIISSLIVFS